jgi:uncharacterized membrane protein
MTNLSELMTAPATLTATDAVRRRAIFLSIMGLAVFLRIYGLSVSSLNGDEYGSLLEAGWIGLNWNSIAYSVLMHFWMQFGSSEFWLRLPAAIFGVATVAVLFRLGEQLGEWRTGVVAALLAATSPFDIYHSQEVRFYSLFILMAAAFMWATVNFVNANEQTKRRSWVYLILTGVGLFFSHFIGPVALYVQGGCALYARAGKRTSRWLLIALAGAPLVGCVLLLTPPVRHQLWRVYQSIGNAPSSFEPTATAISIVNLAKAAFAGFIFLFGYHVYPLRFLLIVPGLLLAGVLLIAGTRRLWIQKTWTILPFAYLAALVAIYVVLDATGGRLANGISPRHVAFIWPMFLMLVALGITAFKKPVWLVLAAAMLLLNVASVRAGWQRDWTYGPSVDYRSGAVQASHWITNDTLVIHDGRSQPPIEYYFPKAASRLSFFNINDDPDSLMRVSNGRVVFVTDDWESDRRRDADRLLAKLSDRYAIVDSYVDYPFMQFLLEQKPKESLTGFGLQKGTRQLAQPLSNYGIEFQDLHLPISTTVAGERLSVLGAYGLPDLEGQRELNLPLSETLEAKRVILLANVTGAAALSPGQTVAGVLVEDKSGKTTTMPLRMNQELTSWDRRCESTALCQTIWQWHKRLTLSWHSGYPEALRDFAAGIHAVTLNLDGKAQVKKLTIRYSAGSGTLYLWGLALPEK